MARSMSERVEDRVEQLMRGYKYTRQFFLILLIIFSLFILYSSYKKFNRFRCDEPEIEYKFVPRTFQQEQRDPTKASIFFKGMFEDPSLNAYGGPLILLGHRRLAGEVLST